MLRTAVLRTPWQHVPSGEFARLVSDAGLAGIVLDSPAESWEGSIASDRHGDARVAAIRVAAFAPAEFEAADLPPTPLDSRVVIIRPAVFPRPAESDRAAWRELGAWASHQDVMLAVDWGGSNSFDARAMWKFVNDVAHERIRLCFDLGMYASTHPFSHWEVALQRVVAQVGVVWLSDWSGTPGDASRPPLGEGTIDFFRVAEIVRSVSADVLAVIDVGMPTRARGTIAECEETLTQSVAHLRRCGWFDP